MRMRTAIGLSLALLVVSTAAMAKQTPSSHHPTAPNIKAKPVRDAAAERSKGKRHRVAGRGASRTAHRAASRAESRAASRTESRRTRVAREETTQLPPADRYIQSMRVIGRREIGSAAWYGGRHVGRRTASGDLLDNIHVTAAHRTLPLYSLVRVTNLSNGRSVIAKITDRGPVSHSLLIDVSPMAADQLDMKHAGIATVAVEPVAPAAQTVAPTAASVR
jgi:rare lipoprotein A